METQADHHLSLFHVTLSVDVVLGERARHFSLSTDCKRNFGTMFSIFQSLDIFYQLERVGTVGTVPAIKKNIKLKKHVR